MWTLPSVEGTGIGGASTRASTGLSTTSLRSAGDAERVVAGGEPTGAVSSQ